MTQDKKYVCAVTLLTLVAIPTLAQIVTYAVFFLALCFPIFDSTWSALALWLAAIFAIEFGIWRRVAESGNLPQRATVRYLPIAIASAFHVVALAVFAATDDAIVNANALSLGLFVPFVAKGVFIEMYSLPFLIANLFATALSAVVFFFLQKGHGKKVAFALAGIVAILAGVATWQHYDDHKHILPLHEPDVARVHPHHVSSWQCLPFATNNTLCVISPQPTLAITNDHPRLNGSEKLCPLYGSIAQAVYKELDELRAKSFVFRTGTRHAFAKLRTGDIDIFFGPEPSEEMFGQAATPNGTELHMFPIAKDALVFFANAQNPVDNLTLPQLRDIYQNEIANWRDVGGEDLRIIAFQHPEKSDEQSAMRELMQNRKLAKPPQEEVGEGQGIIIYDAAAYRNYAGAIGYASYVCMTQPPPDADIKLLAVDGVAPSVANIRNGAYPLTEHVYAVTTREPDGNVKALLGWILSPEGQAAVEQCGYVGIAE